MSLLLRLERKFGRWAIPHLTLYIVAGQVAAYIFAVGVQDERGAGFVKRLLLDPQAVMAGEWWRLVTFLFLPPAMNPIFAFFVFYFLWLMGTALEAQWGSFRYNVYILVGWLATVGTGMGLGLLLPEPIPAGGGMMLETVFLAFATLYPDFTVYIMFVFPVKVKWLAWLTAALLAFQFVTGPGWLARGMVVASVANYLLFFWPEILGRMRHGARVMQHKAKHYANAPAETYAFHTCSVCGKTDRSDPQAEFRYCPVCKACLCMDDLAGHKH